MKYPVNEIFMSLQGEGYNQGKQVIFLRLAKCNLSCSFCDTDYHQGTDTSIDNIMKRLSEYSCKSVLITGGEPTIYNLSPLLKAMKELDYWIGIESNGTYHFDPVRDLLDYITISPKQHYIGQKTNELRVLNTNLGINQLQYFEEIFMADHYYLSPLETNGKFNVYQTLELARRTNERLKQHWQISLQLHKLANIR
jgi:7-carboxy-7-deazaguanine synthase